jgi:hypothetical protein
VIKDEETKDSLIEDEIKRSTLQFEPKPEASESVKKSTNPENFKRADSSRLKKDESSFLDAEIQKHLNAESTSKCESA